MPPFPGQQPRRSAMGRTISTVRCARTCWAVRRSGVMPCRRSHWSRRRSCVQSAREEWKAWPSVSIARRCPRTRSSSPVGVSTATSGGAPASSSSYRAMVSRMERARLRVGAGEQRAHGAVPRSAQSGEKLGAGDQAAAQGAVQGDERVQLRCAAHEGEDGGLLVGERRAQRVDGSAGVPVDDDAPDAVYGVLVVGGDNVEPASGAPGAGR